MKTKTFDCVQMKRKGAEHLQTQLSEMTEQQRKEFWAARHQDMLSKQERLRERHA
jgi:hypothetical protein